MKAKNFHDGNIVAVKSIGEFEYIISKPMNT